MRRRRRSVVVAVVAATMVAVLAFSIPAMADDAPVEVKGQKNGYSGYGY